MPRPLLGDRRMTPAEKQARRRENYRLMQDALARIEQAATAKEAREIAREVLDEVGRPAVGG